MHGLFLYVESSCILNKYKSFYICILVYLKVTNKAKVGATAGYHDSGCSKDCPSSCNDWKLWTASETWKSDNTLTIKCEGQFCKFLDRYVALFFSW